MPGESPTKWQAQAYRFGIRRLESAVSSGDPLLRGETSRRRFNISLIVSMVLAAMILGGFAVYGFIRPEPTIGNAAVVIDSDTGGVFVSRAGRLYPALNLSSALLAAGRGQSNERVPSMTAVDTDTIGEQPRGPLLGIPGAPDVLPKASKLAGPQWTVCDRTTLNTALPPGSAPTVTTTAIIGEKRPATGTPATTGALLVSADNGATAYLVWSGRRSRIDPTDDTIRLAFGLASGTTPRPISAALLNVLPESPDLVVPVIDTSGPTPAYASKLGVGVGDVFALQHADGTTSVYVALPAGVELITPLVGDLIRDEFGVASRIALIAPRLLRQSPVANTIDVAVYPSVRPRILGYEQFPVTCVARSATATTSVVLAMGAVPLPARAKPVKVTQPGDLTVDDVYLHPGSGAVFSSATPTQPSGHRALYVVTDEGVAYPVVSDVALGYLGFAGKDVRRTAPELMSLLPTGATLDPDEAVHFYPRTGASAGSLPSAAPGSGGPPG